jgi:signal peptide peptidase SppA
MKHYPHLMARLFNVPLLIDPSKASVIFKGIASRMGVVASGEVIHGPIAEHSAKRSATLPAGSKWCSTAEGGYMRTPNGIAVVTVEGSLVHTAAGAYPPSGMTSYGEIQDQIEAAAADPIARAILLDVDSPGGEGSDSAFALSARIRELRKVKPIWGIVDETACSAAYLLISGAEKVFAPALSYSGSIGVYMALLDATAADKMEGLAWTFIKAGDHKLDGNPSLPLSKEFVERMQADVDATYARFLIEVGANRPKLGAKGAQKTEARFYRGDEALSLGLIDGIADFDTAIEQLSTRIAAAPGVPGAQMQVRQDASAEASAGDVSHETAAAATIQETDMSENNQQPGAAAGNVVDISTARKEAGDAARASAVEIAQLCSLAGRPELAAGFIESGKSVADVRTELLAAKAKSGAAEVNSHHAGEAAQVAGGGKALIGECQRLADSAAKKKSA